MLWAMQSTFTSTAAATIAPGNVYRSTLTIFNEGAGALHVLLGARTTVSTTNYTVRIASGAFWQVPDGFIGAVQGIFAAAGTARVTEVNETDH
jgi:hypothetical protein